MNLLSFCVVVEHVLDTIYSPKDVRRAGLCEFRNYIRGMITIVLVWDNFEVRRPGGICLSVLLLPV